MNPPSAVRRLGLLLICCLLAASAFGGPGATVPWTTYEAEAMATSGTVLGPSYTPNTVEAESSGRSCVQLTSGEYVQFTAQGGANSLIVRYSVPDTSGGGGTNYTLSLYTNGVFATKLQFTSVYSWLYGAYPFVNTPSSGSPRNFYDEVRTNDLSINPGDTVRLEVDSGDTASSYIIDLVDLENVAAPLTNQPANSLSIMSYGAGGTGATDDTSALNNCISAAQSQGKSVWLPAGVYKITSSINLPSNLTLQGAGMWYSSLVGDPTLYSSSSRRVTLNGSGSNIHLSDFAIVGRLNYRNDSEPNDGLGGAYGTGSTISRIWVEHTKTGAWIVNSQGLVVDSCRFRDTIADGINTVVGMQGTIVTNCTSRGTGDDCFAMWPATYTSQTYTPGFNVFTHCTGQLPFLANGGSIYGGVSNTIQDCLFQDLPYGCGILIGTTFAVGPNVFSGVTTAQRCNVNRCGGYDAGFGWRGAVQLCLQNSSLGNLCLNNLNISNSVSAAFSIIAPGGNPSTGLGTLSNTVISYVNIPNYGVGYGGSYGLWATSDALGAMTVSNCTIVDYENYNPSYFTFNFITSSIPVVVGTSPAGLTFTVDGTPYTTQQNLSWLYGSVHSLAAGATQSGGAGTQYVWDNWSDGGAISHSVTSSVSTNYTADFTTAYYLTMNAGTGGAATPASGWTKSGAAVNIQATPGAGYAFVDWTGSGTGAYSGSNALAGVTMNGPISESAGFEVASQPVSGILVNGDGSVTVSYGTTPGARYHLEVTTNLSPPSWTLVAGSATNASGGTVTFTDSDPPNGPQCYYRSVSP